MFASKYSPFTSKNIIVFMPRISKKIIKFYTVQIIRIIEFSIENIQFAKSSNFWYINIDNYTSLHIMYNCRYYQHYRLISGKRGGKPPGIYYLFLFFTK